MSKDKYTKWIIISVIGAIIVKLLQIAIFEPSRSFTRFSILHTLVDIVIFALIGLYFLLRENIPMKAYKVAGFVVLGLVLVDYLSALYRYFNIVNFVTNAIILAPFVIFAFIILNISKPHKKNVVLIILGVSTAFQIFGMINMISINYYERLYAISSRVAPIYALVNTLGLLLLTVALFLLVFRASKTGSYSLASSISAIETPAGKITSSESFSSTIENRPISDDQDIATIRDGGVHINVRNIGKSKTNAWEIIGSILVLGVVIKMALGFYFRELPYLLAIIVIGSLLIYISTRIKKKQRGSQSKVTQTDSVLCPSCTKPVSPDDVCCPYCGNPLKIICQKCGNPVQSDFVYCPKCTTRIQNDL